MHILLMREETIGPKCLPAHTARIRPTHTSPINETTLIVPSLNPHRNARFMGVVCCVIVSGASYVWH